MSIVIPISSLQKKTFHFFILELRKFMQFSTDKTGIALSSIEAKSREKNDTSTPRYACKTCTLIFKIDADLSLLVYLLRCCV